MLNKDYSVAELVIMGFEGKTLGPSTLKNIRDEKISNFILFTSPNFESKEQLFELNETLQRLVKENGSPFPAIISADQEGGRVQRFRNGFTMLPSAHKVGTLPSIETIIEYARIQASELAAAGINLNYAPDCDVNTNPANPVIGDRSYSPNAKRASEVVTAIIQGHYSENVLTCLKHFPGHGDTHLDSHEALPTVTTPLQTLREREWLPFRAGITAGSPFVMSAHILLPEIDKTHPGTFSKTFLNQYLRGELNFQGAIISDDMEMGAVTHHYGKEEAPILALEGGCDLLCYRHEEEALIAIESIKKALREGRLNSNSIENSINRTRKIKAGLKLHSQSKAERLELIGHPTHSEFLRRHLK